MAKYLSHSPDTADGMLWIGPEGTFTPLHHDLTNNLFAQVVGRKKFIMAPASQLPKIYNDPHVFSEIDDLESDELDLIAIRPLKTSNSMKSPSNLGTVYLFRSAGGIKPALSTSASLSHIQISGGGTTSTRGIADKFIT